MQISDKTHEATVMIYCAPFGRLNKPEQHDDKVSAVTASNPQAIKSLGSERRNKEQCLGDIKSPSLNSEVQFYVVKARGTSV